MTILIIVILAPSGAPFRKNNQKFVIYRRSVPKLRAALALNGMYKYILYTSKIARHRRAETAVTQLWFDSHHQPIKGGLILYYNCSILVLCHNIRSDDKWLSIKWMDGWLDWRTDSKRLYYLCPFQMPAHYVLARAHAIGIKYTFMWTEHIFFRYLTLALCTFRIHSNDWGRIQLHQKYKCGINKRQTRKSIIKE